MSQTCETCGKPNRDIARYCKWCGATVGANASATSIDALAGLSEIKQRLREIENVVDGMKRDGNLVRMNYHTMIVGNSGTAKSLIGTIFFETLRSYGLLTKDAPEFFNSTEFEGMDFEALEQVFANAAGGMIIIDNVQDLIQNGEPSSRLKKTLSEMDRHQNDPIVILSGLPTGFREFIDDEENANFVGRFRNVFIVPDYDSQTLYEIVVQGLKSQYGLSPAEETKEKLRKRCRHLSREMKNPDANLGAKNGYLAKKEVDSIVHAYYLRQGTDKVVLPEDIAGQVFEEKSAEEILATLDSFVGMENIKKDIRGMYNEIAVTRRQTGENADVAGQFNLHAVITGNPGTGKTTVVRTLGEIYSALGVLDTGHVIEADRSKLVAEYQGQTAVQTNRICDQAMGGVLFVDEAYALKQGDGDAFGQEAIDTLLKRVEDDRGKFCCIVAGYQNEMKEFMSTNPGLDSRFPKRFHLDDYNAEELFAIFEITAQANNYTLEADAKERAREYFEALVARKTKNFANGREARNLFEKAKNLLSQRLAEAVQSGDVEAAALTTITAEDIPTGRSEAGPSADEAMAKLDKLVGLSGVKEKIRQLIDTLEFNRMRNQQKPLNEHFIFTGNPGTGKTTVARILADVFYAIGLLPTNNLVEADRSTLVATTVGGTAPQVNGVVDRALGGVLFIDEAYTLNQGDQDSYGREAVNTLLKRLEDDRGKFVTIVAGYSNEMSDFLSTNPGLQSRFRNKIHFDDYSAEEMVKIFKFYVEDEAFTLADGVDEPLSNLFRGIVARKSKNFGNARTVRDVFERTRDRLSSRVMAMKDDGASAEEIQSAVNTITALDLPMPQSGKRQSVDSALSALYEQVGLDGVKRKVEELVKVLKVQELRGREKPLGIHFVFTGNPGTGKTTIARILADVFYAIGLLPSNTLIEADRSKMVAGYKGQTSIQVNQLCDRAMGGVLFIDEAYALKQDPQDDFGQDAIDTLLKRMEDDRGKFIVIAAGYSKEMERFLNSNSGLDSRFSEKIHFEDYNGEQMTEIFKLFAKKDGFVLDTDAEPELREIFDYLYEHRGQNFGNARTVRQIFSKSVEALSSRIVELQQSGALPEEELRSAANTITVADLPTAGSPMEKES